VTLKCTLAFCLGVSRCVRRVQQKFSTEVTCVFRSERLCGRCTRRAPPCPVTMATVLIPIEGCPVPMSRRGTETGKTPPLSLPLRHRTPDRSSLTFCSYHPASKGFARFLIEPCAHQQCMAVVQRSHGFRRSRFLNPAFPRLINLSFPFFYRVFSRPHHRADESQRGTGETSSGALISSPLPLLKPTPALSS